MVDHIMSDLELLAAKSVTLKYFEKGHTFMAADSVHARIEKVLKRNQGKIYRVSQYSCPILKSNYRQTANDKSILLAADSSQTCPI